MNIPPPAEWSFTVEPSRQGFVHYRGRVPLLPDYVDDPDESISDNTIYSYGAWGDYTSFFVAGLVVPEEDRWAAEDLIGSGGTASGSRPVAAVGTATWTGAMVGRKDFRFLRGDAELVYDFGDSTIDVTLSEIHDIENAQTHPSLVWENLPVTESGSFEQRGVDTETIGGTFYGPNHEEAGGVFFRDEIGGAFGAKRE